MAMSVVYSNAFGGVIAENRGGVVSEYVPDTLGSTIGLLNSTGTTLTDRWEYWPYGEVLSRTGTNPTPLTFLGVIGYFKDILDKLFYVRARHLRVDLARWLTVDELWPLTPSYAYCGLAPTREVDPSGLNERPPGPPVYSLNRPPSCQGMECSGLCKCVMAGGCSETGDCIKVKQAALTVCCDLDGDGVYHLIAVQVDLYICKFDGANHTPPGETTRFPVASGSWQLIVTKHGRPIPCFP